MTQSTTNNELFSSPQNAVLQVLRHVVHRVRSTMCSEINDYHLILVGYADG